MSDNNPSFVPELGKDFGVNPGESVFHALFSEYEQVVFRSLITTFGLDMFISDRHGGDVDTIHNVRAIGTDPMMEYKDLQNEAAYQYRGAYDHNDLGGYGSNYQRMKREARKHYQEDSRNNTVQDAYEDFQSFQGRIYRFLDQQRTETVMYT